MHWDCRAVRWALRGHHNDMRTRAQWPSLFQLSVLSLVKSPVSSVFSSLRPFRFPAWQAWSWHWGLGFPKSMCFGPENSGILQILTSEPFYKQVPCLCDKPGTCQVLSLSPVFSLTSGFVTRKHSCKSRFSNHNRLWWCFLNAWPLHWVHFFPF